MLDTTSMAVQNWLSDVSNDTVFTTVVALSVFVLGYFFNRFYDNWKEKIKKGNIREFVLSSLEAIVPAIEKQITAFNELKQQLASKKHLDYIYTESTSLNFEGLDSIPRDEVFHSFVRGHKKKRVIRIENLNALWGATDFIRHQKETARQTFIKFSEDYRRYLLYWNENVDSIARLHDEYLMMAGQASVHPSEDPFLREFNLIVYHLAQSGEPKSWENEKMHLLDPLLEVCKVNHVDARANVVMKKISQANYAYDNRVHLLELYGIYFDHQASALTEKKNSILHCVKFFRE